MGLFTEIKALRAYQKHGKGELEEARRLYEEAMNEGLANPRYILPYCVLLIRSGEYQKARDILVRIQKNPGMTPDQKVQLFMNYAACCFKMGEREKGIAVLERQHAKQPTGMVYQTLGYLYVDKYDMAHTPDFDAVDAENAAKAAAAEAARLAQAAESDDEDDDEEPEEPEPIIPARQAWQQGIEKARAFCEEALEYDEEDPICLDNMGQFLYRVMDDKAAAEEWFKKAYAIKDSQIDTLWFLSRYDLDRGDVAGAKAKLTSALEGRFSPLNFVTKAIIEAELARLG